MGVDDWIARNFSVNSPVPNVHGTTGAATPFEQDDDMGFANINEIAARLQAAREAYYNGAPVMSDAAYDRLEDRLREMAPTHPLLQQVGAKPLVGGGWPKVRHTIPMGSLNKAQDAADLANWHANCRSISGVDALIVTDKLDGISVSLHYRNGALAQALTRGDGVEGEDITRNVRMMMGFPLSLPATYEDFADERAEATPADVWVRGEIVCRLSDFNTFFKGESNPRNTASGTAKRQSDAAKCKHLTVVAYQFLPNGVALGNKEAELQALREMGFATPNWGTYANLAEVESCYQDYIATVRDSLDYLIDGLVVEVNDNNLHAMLGELNGRPKAAIAYKFPHDSKQTTLRDIVWQVGKSGRITPVAEFDTVNLAGANVSRASLHNISNIRELAGAGNQFNLAKGDQILVSRRNDVIPYVESVLTPSDKGDILYPPTACPCCHGATTQDGEYLVCRNDDCAAQVTGAIRRWVSKIGVLHFGDALIEAMVDSGLVSDVADLYTVDPAKVALLEMDGRRVGGAADRAFASLRDKMTLPLHTFLGSLGLSPLIGRSMVQTIMDGGFHTLADMRAAYPAQIGNIAGVGPTKAVAFVTGLKAKEALIDKLLASGVSIKTATGGLVGQTFCLTGFRDATLAQAIEAQGGTVKDSASKGLTYLVALDPNGNSTKLQAARKNGTLVIGKADAYKLAGL